MQTLTLQRHQYKEYTILIVPTKLGGYTWHVQQDGEDRLIESRAVYLSPETALESAQQRIDRRKARLEIEELLDNEIGDRIDSAQLEIYLKLLEYLRQIDSGE